MLAGPDATPETIEIIRIENGFDKPVIVQYLAWLNNLVHGDLGTSYLYRQPVLKLALKALAPTFQLVLSTFILTLLIGIPVGVLAASKAKSWVDILIGNISALVLGFPPFWFGLILLMFFAVRLNWVPASGWVPFSKNPIEAMRLLLLPSLSIAIIRGLALARFVRSAMLESLAGDYIRTAKAKGVPKWQIIWKHAFPNALVPTVTILGIQLGVMLGGAVVIERVFTRPGISSLLIGAIATRDYAVVQGVVLVIVVWFALINLIVDISYGIIDPRIRRQA
jgi:peptide/nickel transport system permease protein